LLMVSRWASEIAFKELAKSKAFRDSFVDLDLNLGTVSTEQRRTLKVSELHVLPGNFVILGDPGSGKTTSLKKTALRLLQEPRGSHAPVPILVQLRDLLEG